MKQRRNEGEDAAVARYEAMLDARDQDFADGEDAEVRYWRKVRAEKRARHEQGLHYCSVQDCPMCERGEAA